MSNKTNMKDQVVMITGISGQLGQSLANAVVDNGGKVLGIDTSQKEMEKVAEFYKWNKSLVLLKEADIRIRKNIEDALNDGINYFGKVTSQVNNAGVGTFDHWQKRDEKSFSWVCDVNLKGTFFCMQTFLDYCLNYKIEASIVNIASIYGLISSDPRIYTDLKRLNSEVYSATKAGIIQMTKYFSVNASIDGLKTRVNAVAPGGIRNPWNPQGKNFQKLYSEKCPMGRLAEIEEIVHPILFLLSKKASYINGHTLVVDGGMTAW